MDNLRFGQILDEIIDKTNNVLAKKASEYADDVDRLRNFKQAAHLQGVTQEQALNGMMAKHIVSIFDMVASGEVYSEAQWDEKIGDAINYLVLLKAITVERAES